MAAVKPVPVERIENAILVLRGHKVMLDTDLAALYGVSTKRFNEQVRRNHSRFPMDFMFQLTGEEWDALRSQFATLNAGRGRHRKYFPYAFTEHGAIMAATILNSPRATEISVYVVRAFVRLRETLATHKALASKLETLEKQTAALAFKHDALASNTRAQFKQVMDTLRELMAQPEPPPEPKRRPIGFVYPKEK
jgi:hypothetical protein